MEDKNLNLFIGFFILLTALTAPLILMPIEKLLPYPYVIEELIKLILVLFILKYLNKKLYLIFIIISGLFFSLSESLFYLGSAYGAGYAFLFGSKLGFTLFVHLFTLLLFYFSCLKSKKLLFFSLPVAIFFHFFLNKMF